MTIRVAWTSTFPKESVGAKVFLEPQVQALRDINVEIDLINLGDLYSLSRFAAIRASLLQSIGKYDLFHSQWGSGCGLLTSTLPVRKVVTLRGSDWYLYPRRVLDSGFRGILGPTLTRLSISKFHAVIAVSERMRLDLEPYVKRKLTISLPTPIDLQCFPELSSAEARSRLGFSGDRSKWILFVTARDGNEIKRPKLAKSAFEYCRNSLPNVRLIEISGVGRSELPMWYCAADVLLLTSTHEGWPNVVKEALACNRPFVSTDVSDLRSLAMKTQTCKICDQTSESLGKALIDTLTAPKRENLRVLIEDMSLERSAQKLKAVYEKVLEFGN